MYIAHENYTSMLLQLDQQQEEITNKIASLKAVKEEMDKKEVNFGLEKKNWGIFLDLFYNFCLLNRSF